MIKCITCNKETNNLKFCSRSCSAKETNKARAVPRGNCEFCGAQLILLDRKYCNLKCSGQMYSLRSKTKAKDYIELWLNNEISGLKKGGVVHSRVKQWLRDTRGDCCELCGWQETNVVTGKVPVVADHIDGNYLNNRPENLRLVCPNCDSLQATYCGLNKGNGRGKERQIAAGNREENFTPKS